MTAQPFIATASHAGPFAELSELFHGTNIVDAGERNKKLILQCIRANRAISCKQISLLLALTVPAVHKIIKDLSAANFITPVASVQNERGKPERYWGINAEYRYTMGLSLEAETSILVCLDFTGKVVKKTCFATEPLANMISALRPCICDILEMATAANTHIDRLGVSISDSIYQLNECPGVHELNDLIIFNELTEMAEGLGFSIYFENSLAAATIGEMLYGGGLKSDTFLYLQIGSSLGGSLVVNRQYCRGHYGVSKSISSLPKINPFEMQISDVGKTLGQALPPTNLFKALKLTHFTDQRMVEFDFSPSFVTNWIETFADYMFFPILNILCLMNLEAIYVGGAIPRFVQQRICAEVKSRLSANPLGGGKSVTIEPAAWEEDACAVGAAIAALENHG